MVRLGHSDHRSWDLCNDENGIFENFKIVKVHSFHDKSKNLIFDSQIQNLLVGWLLILFPNSIVYLFFPKKSIGTLWWPINLHDMTVSGQARETKYFSLLIFQLCVNFVSMCQNDLKNWHKLTVKSLFTQPPPPQHQHPGYM